MIFVFVHGVLLNRSTTLDGMKLLVNNLIDIRKIKLETLSNYTSLNAEKLCNQQDDTHFDYNGDDEMGSIFSNVVQVQG